MRHKHQIHQWNCSQKCADSDSDLCSACPLFTKPISTKLGKVDFDLGIFSQCLFPKSWHSLRTLYGPRQSVNALPVDVTQPALLVELLLRWWLILHFRDQNYPLGITFTIEGYDFLLCDREFLAYSQSDTLDSREGAQMVYSHPGHLSQHTEVTFEDSSKILDRRVKSDIHPL